MENRTSYFSSEEKAIPHSTNKEEEIVILMRRGHAEIEFQSSGFIKRTFTLTDDTLVELKINLGSRMLKIKNEEDEEILWFRKTHDKKQGRAS